MKPWMIWPIVLLVVAWLALLKIGVHLLYENGTFSLKLLIGPVKLSIGQKQSKEKEKRKKISSGKGGKKKRCWLALVLNNWEEIVTLLGKVLSVPVLEVLRLQISVGAADSQACAMTYGSICAAVGALLGPLESAFAIRRRDIHVDCNFEMEKIEAEGEAAVTLRVYESFVLVAAILRVAFKLYRETKTDMKVV